MDKLINSKPAVMIANRGEIALRVIRACIRLELPTIAIYSEADADAAHVRLADKAVCIGAASPRQSYLDGGAILLAAIATGARAIHPGYGFLAENASFAEEVEKAGLIFIGPRPESIHMMGDKIAAKAAMKCTGMPCVPGSQGALTSDPMAQRQSAAEVGYPLLVKAAAGGGGRGMRVVDDASMLEAAIIAASEEARSAFGDGSVYLERYLQKPRHVEIQVLCDQHGNAVYLGARDCSMQRRHQKLVEEAPPPGISAKVIRALGEKCLEACRSIGYRGVGTFEFLYENGAFFFIEMNTRIQVEHPVTEMVTGIDIVAQQIRIAFGEPLPFDQEEIHEAGASIECRINAESPFDALPDPGTIDRLHLPGGPGVRVDTHITEGSKLPASYDSLMMKIICHGRNRAEAIERMQAALRETRIIGVASTIDMHRSILGDADFRSGNIDVHFVERNVADWRKQHRV